MNWKSRGDRIARMQEKDQFNRFFMPLAYGVAVVGLLILGWAGLVRLEGGHGTRELLAVGQLLLCAPVPVWIFRFFRGHYSSRLKD